MVQYVVFIGSVVLCTFASFGDNKNLLTNPGFETVKDGKIDSWVVAAFSEGGKGDLQPSEEKPHSGKRCAHITGNAEWATFVSKQVPIKAGKTYELKGFLRTAKGQAYIKIDYFKGDKYIGMTMTEASDARDWTEQTVTSELSNYPEATHITATLVGAGGEFEAWFDDLSVVEK